MTLQCFDYLTSELGEHLIHTIEPDASAIFVLALQGRLVATLAPLNGLSTLRQTSLQIGPRDLDNRKAMV